MLRQSFYCHATTLLFAALAVPALCMAQAQQDYPKESQQQSIAFSPKQVQFSEALLKKLKLPQGFRVSVFARDLGHPRMMAVADDGTVYVTRPIEGDVIALQDDGSGHAGKPQEILSGIAGVNGILLHQGKLYVAPPTQVLVANLGKDGKAQGKATVFVDNLPFGGRHPNRTLRIGPDGMLYISIGSPCNACKPENKEHATLTRVRLDGSGREIFATGLRNSMAFGWQPVSKNLYAMDNGIDWLGGNEPPEELNHVEQGKDYGWPYCFDKQKTDSRLPPVPSGSRQQYCSKTQPMLMGYTAHAAPIFMVYYTASQFPQEYRNDAFVTFHGSWNRKPASGYRVVRIHFDGSGNPVSFEDFLTGFLSSDGDEQFGRPAGIAIAKDGSLLISDDENGVIYRVSYKSQ